MKLAVMGGSLRKDSLNRRLLEHLAGHLRGLGHEVEELKGEDLRLPLLDGDAAVPEGVVQLAERMEGIRGLLIVSPEYNAGIPPHLKNAVDWLSTLKPSPFAGLPVQLASASPGAFGGARALVAWRATLANLGALALPGALTVPLADRNLDALGAPLEPRTLKEADRVLEAFLDLLLRLGA